MTTLSDTFDLQAEYHRLRKEGLPPSFKRQHQSARDKRAALRAELKAKKIPVPKRPRD